MTNEEMILKNIDKIENDELKKAIIELIKEKNDLLDYVKLDHLTGIYNRRILESVRNYDAVVMCDIDGFKSINDTYGHDAGDKVLKKVARTFSNNTRINDIVCRYGGDEFLLIFNDCNEKVIIERIKKIHTELFNCVPFTNITISIGIAKKTDNKTLDEMITEADKALYYSKRKGKNIITTYDELQNDVKLSKW